MAEIVRITPDTAGLLGRVADEVFDHAIDPARLATYLATPEVVLFVAVADGQVVAQGRGVAIPNPDGPPVMFLENLGTSPDYRRQGLATRLLQAVRDWGRAQGCREFWVATETENAGAVAFYRTLGLRETPLLMYD
ncbi:GNAT family N-acetyltransferase [Halovulum marinum]|nr:GNAT family N-acetyltransferase [Halovulum marinum]